MKELLSKCHPTSAVVPDVGVPAATATSDAITGSAAVGIARGGMSIEPFQLLDG
jgi:hypothetical protein